MREPVLWLGGWASHLACWDKAIQALYPNREHLFLDAHAVLDRPALLPETASRLPAGGTLAAWSMGNLLLHKFLADGGRGISCRILSLCPIFDFCGPGSPWPPSMVKSMERKLPNEHEAVLRDFWERVKAGSAVFPNWEHAWLRQSREYDGDALLRGLAFLRETAVKPSAWIGNPDARKAGNVVFVASPDDPLAPFGRVGPDAGGFPEASVIPYPGGHLPFLCHPEIVGPLL